MTKEALHNMGAFSGTCPQCGMVASKVIHPMCMNNIFPAPPCPWNLPSTFFTAPAGTLNNPVAAMEKNTVAIMPNNEAAKIDWNIGDEYDDAGDGHVTFHYAEGESADGRKWSGSAVLCDGDLQEIEDVEPA